MHTATPRFLKSQAFTLIELLVSLALFATILFFSIPFVTSWHQKNQIKVIQEDIQSAIRYAKTQALTSGNDVILTPLQGSNDWSNGMLLFFDNAKHRDTADDRLIHEWHWNSPGIQVSWRGFQSSQYLLFSSDVSQNAANGTFLIKSHSNYTAKIVINKLGRIRR